MLKSEDGGEPGTSHGMCPACEKEMSGLDDPAYQAYLDNPTIDPRD